MKKICIIIVICILATVSCDKEKSAENSLKEREVLYTGKKILIIHSYHPGHKGVIENDETLHSVFSKTGVDYKKIYLDTQRNFDEAFKRRTAMMAKKTIEEYKPDVLITFDDNAFKYLIMPYYKDSDLPVVFVGIDWDASVYGAPYTNTAGLVSVALTVQMLDYMKEFSKGERIAWLGHNSFTAKKETKAYKEILA